MFWDDSAGVVTWLTPGTGLAITTTTIDASGAPGIYKNLQSSVAATNSNATQPWFATAGAVTIEASTAYEFEGELFIGTTAASTTYTLSLSWGGTATFTNARWFVQAQTQTAESGAGTATPITTLLGLGSATVLATGTQMRKSVLIKGLLVVNAGGTLIPQFAFSAAPNQSPLVLHGTRFALRKVASSAGTWS
jgi:hypothetical protein